MKLIIGLARPYKIHAALFATQNALEAA